MTLDMTNITEPFDDKLFALHRLKNEDCCDCETARARFWFHNGVAAEKANVAAEVDVAEELVKAKKLVLRIIGLLECRHCGGGDCFMDDKDDDVLGCCYKCQETVDELCGDCEDCEFTLACGQQQCVAEVEDDEVSVPHVRGAGPCPMCYPMPCDCDRIGGDWAEEHADDLRRQLLDDCGVDVVGLSEDYKSVVLENSRLKDEIDRNEEYNAANIIKIKQAQSTYAQELVLAMNRIAVLEKKLTKRNILDDAGKLVC